MIPFAPSAALTLGVEIELQLLDAATLDLSPRAVDMLALCEPSDKVKPEIFQSMIEINTGICADAHAADADLRESFALVARAARQLGLRLATPGTHPFARYNERVIYPADRYRMLIDRNQWIARRLMIFGLHVHLGMESGDACIRFNNFFLHLVPHLLAISASSPFWQGEDTGLASSRSTIFEACPTAGHPCRVEDWAEFSELCERLQRSRAITSHKDLWWDVRPSPDFGTLEIRCCDGLPNRADTLALVAFIHALAHWYQDHADYDTRPFAPSMWMMRENKWRAARHGLEAEIIVNPRGDCRPLREDIAMWLTRLEPYIAEFGYDAYMLQLQAMLERPGYVRQREAFAAREDIGDVAALCADEFDKQQPI